MLEKMRHNAVTSDLVSAGEKEVYVKELHYQYFHFRCEQMTCCDWPKLNWPKLNKNDKQKESCIYAVSQLFQEAYLTYKAKP